MEEREPITSQDDEVEGHSADVENMELGANDAESLDVEGHMADVENLERGQADVENL